MINAVFVTHGPIGDALIDAIRGIIGSDQGLFALDVMNMSAEEIYQRIAALANAPENKDEGLLILASLKGGSCWNVSASIAGTHPNVKVVCGVNLPMALSFVTKRQDYALDELAKKVCKDGELGIKEFVK
jgi:mannose/fructose/sorbose-specific phosphotransferase system IIA component